MMSRTRRPVWLRATTDRARRLASELGVKTKGDGWVLAHLDASSMLSAVSAADGIQLRSVAAHRPMDERSSRDTGVDRVRLGENIESARTGRGVLVGIVDTGIDLSHPAFFRANGTSRVVAVWDQDAATGSSPGGFGYGSECNERMIATGRCTIGDPIGHGTHVTGIAAGGGSVVGVAQESDIAVVRSDTFTRIADAVAYLVDLADQRDEPLVINISVGGHYGPHDGRTPLETYLGEVVGGGRLLVAAAGNDGSDRVHVGTQLDTHPVRFGIEGLPAAGTTSQAIIEMWSEPLADVQVALEVWQNDTVVSTIALDATDSELLDGTVEFNGTKVADVSYGVDYISEHKRARRAIIIDRAAASPMPVGIHLAVRMSGQGRIDGWISASDYRYGTPRFSPSHRTGWIGGDGLSSVTVPATSPNIIAVGSYTVRTTWHSEFDGDQRVDGLEYGERAPYSSIGPTLFPGLTGSKPDIMAPGTVVISARAARVQSSPNTVDSERVVMQGTSMAAPHVAGILALMLEANPDLGPRTARRILTETARTDEQTGTTPNDAWGFGKVDAWAAVRRAEQQATGCAQARPTDVLAPIVAAAGLMMLRRLLRRRLRRARAGSGMRAG